MCTFTVNKRNKMIKTTNYKHYHELKEKGISVQFVTKNQMKKLSQSYKRIDTNKNNKHENRTTNHSATF
jgi:hypothetical protein